MLQANGEEVADEASLREILDKAEPKGFLPKKKFFDSRPKTAAITEMSPVQAKTVDKEIRTYGQAYAQFLRKAGADALMRAEEYKTNCDALADRVEAEAEAEANRAVKFLNDINDQAKALDEVYKKHFEV